MMRLSLIAASVAAVLLLARPGHCIDQAERAGAVDALIERDKAKKLLETAEAEASVERKNWLKAYVDREAILAEQQSKLAALESDAAKAAVPELKERAPAPNAPDAPKLKEA